MVLVPGQTIGQKVCLKRLLKEGGMGSVWIADHLGLRCEVAVKFMSPDLVKEAPLVARFTREATAAAQIRSPHVVQVLDHGVTTAEETSGEALPFIVMELLEGEELGKRIKRLGMLPLAEVAKILSQTGRALAKAHQHNIVHRDIKPDNIFLLDADGDLFVKVLDFGIAKQAPTGMTKDFGLTTTGSMVGTPYYMSPEQLLSARDVDFRSDLWSLAVVCYRALTTRVPFRGETLGALCVNIERGVFAPPSRLRADLPPSVDTWFERAMARQPEARFESVREMTDAFERAIEGHTGIPMPRQSGSSRLEDDAGSPVSAPATGDSMVSPPTFDGTSLSGEIPTPRRSRTMALVVAGAALGGMAIAWVAFRLSTPGAAAVGSSSPVSVMSAASVVTPGVAASVTAMASASASAVPVGSGSAGGVGSAKAREISTAKDTGGTKMPLETTARRPQPTADPTQSPAPTSTHRDRGF